MPNYLHECRACKRKVVLFIKLEDFNKPLDYTCECGCEEFIRKICPTPNVGPKNKGHYNSIPKKKEE